MRTEGGLQWTDGAWAALWAGARAAYPFEGCGVLLGVEPHVTGVLSLSNVSSSPMMYYELDSHELELVYEAEEAGRLALMGFWHSHPRTTSEPSSLDRAYAVAGYVYVVCGVDGVTTFGASDQLEEPRP